MSSARELLLMPLGHSEQTCTGKHTRTHTSYRQRNQVHAGLWSMHAYHDLKEEDKEVHTYHKSRTAVTMPH